MRTVLRRSRTKILPLPIPPGLNGLITATTSFMGSPLASGLRSAGPAVSTELRRAKSQIPPASNAAVLGIKRRAKSPTRMGGNGGIPTTRHGNSEMAGANTHPGCTDYDRAAEIWVVRFHERLMAYLTISGQIRASGASQCACRRFGSGRCQSRFCLAQASPACQAAQIPVGLHRI